MPAPPSAIEGADATPTRELARQAVRRHIRNLHDHSRIFWQVPAVRHAFDTRLGRHFHFFPELFIQLKGRSIMRFPDTTLEMLPGGILLIPRGVPHREFIDKRSPAFQNLVFMYSQRDVHVHRGCRSETGDQPLDVMAETLACEPSDDPARYLNDIVAFSTYASDYSDIVVRGLFLAHFACLLQGLESPAPVRDGASGKILQCRRWISQQLSNPDLSVKTLAGWMHCSPDYLSHCFHIETGTRLSRFIHSERIRQAQAMLLDTAMNVSEIAFACGYRDPGHFTRIFRQLNGSPPLAWRKHAANRP